MKINLVEKFAPSFIPKLSTFQTPRNVGPEFCGRGFREFFAQKELGKKVTLTIKRTPFEGAVRILVFLNNASKRVSLRIHCPKSHAVGWVTIRCAKYLIKRGIFGKTRNHKTLYVSADNA